MLNKFISKAGSHFDSPTRLGRPGVILLMICELKTWSAGKQSNEWSGEIITAH